MGKAGKQKGDGGRQIEWESSVWEGCVWASCVWESVCELRGDGGRQIVWKKIRMRELYVKELCANCCVACVAKDTCAKTIESGLGNSLTWLQKHCCRQAAARSVMKVDGLSRCLRQRCPPAVTAVFERLSHWHDDFEADTKVFDQSNKRNIN